MDYDLANEILYSHAKTPLIRPKLAKFQSYYKSKNLSCGDTFEIWLSLEDGNISLGYNVNGCTVNKGVSSLFLSYIERQKVADAIDVINQAKGLITTGIVTDNSAEKLTPLITLYEIPTRWQCGLLCIESTYIALTALLKPSL
jgi:NifU-like protein involved in Fe-S cluster formation